MIGVNIGSWEFGCRQSVGRGGLRSIVFPEFYNQLFSLLMLDEYTPRNLTACPKLTLDCGHKGSDFSVWPFSQPDKPCGILFFN